MKRAVLQVVLLAVMAVSFGVSAEELKAGRLPSVCSFADGVYRFEFPGDRQLSLTFPLNLKQGEYYRIEFEVRCGRGIEAKNGISSLQIGEIKRYQAFRAGKQWTHHVNYLYAETEKGVFSLSLKPSAPDTVEFRNVRCTRIADSDFRKNLFPDGGLESADPALPAWPWPQEEFLSLSRDAGFLVGSCSLVLKKGTLRRAVYALSSTLPVRPGKVYQIAFWGKASRNTQVQLMFESLKKELVVSQEWSRVEWEFSVPAGFPRLGRLRIVHLGDVSGEVYLDDFVFREKADLPQ